MAEKTKKQKHVIPVATFNNITDKEFSIIMANAIKIRLCRLLKAVHVHRRNEEFSRSWIVTSSNQRISNITDHAMSNIKLQ